jgi:uncharacterized protein involved in exopolysaccharide biosynthesis
MSDRYGAQHPDVKRLRVEVARARTEEAKAAAETETAPATPGTAAPKAGASRKAATANPAEVGQARERVETIKSQIALLAKDIDGRKADQQRVARELAECQGRLTEVPMREQELSQITRDYDITKLNYHSLLEKQISAEMSTDMERRQKSERFTIIDPAHVPERPSKPNRPFYITVGSLFGFVLVVVGALAVELRKDRLLGEWELPGDMLVLARVPMISRTRSRSWSGSGRRAAAVATVVLALASLFAARYYLGPGF